MNARRSVPRIVLLSLLAVGAGCGGDDTVEPRTPLPREDTGLEPEPVPARNPLEGCPETLEGTIDVDRTITSGCEVSVPGHVSVDGATLTIESGVTLRFADGAGLVVASFRPATLVVDGSEDAPVVMRAAGNADATWGGLRLGAGANGSSLTDLRLEQGPGGRDWLTVEAEQITRTRVVDGPIAAEDGEDGDAAEVGDSDAGDPPPSGTSPTGADPG